MAALTERFTGRRHTSTLLAALLVAVFVGYVVKTSWAGTEVTTDKLLFFLVTGVTLGSIYAVAASGLVVTYTTSGIFNFAQGAIGMFMAYVYWELKVNHDLATPIALGLTVFVIAPLFGATIERVLMRRLAGASLVAQLVVTIGLLLALMGLANWIWDPETSRPIEDFFGSGEGFHIGETFVPWYRATTILTGIGLAIGFWLLLNRTRIGVAMRAVVDNRDLAALNGVRPGRISMFAWALGSGVAAIAGIFLAEELPGLKTDVLTLLIVDAFAAAIIGRLRSLPWTFAGGMVIGLSLAFHQNFLSWTGRWSSAGLAIPTMILFLALLFLPQARIEGRRTTEVRTPRIPSIQRALVGFGVLLVTVVVLAAFLDRTDVRRLTVGIVTAFILLSLVPLTGWAGQISLAQITFAGIGAWCMVELAGTSGNPAVLIAAAAFAVPFGALMALPALRLQGLYLALASMAFARMAEIVIFDQPDVFGGGGPRIADLSVLDRNLKDGFTVFGREFAPDAGFLVVVTALFCLVGLLVVWLRRGALGRRLVAMRDSPAACATLGVNLTLTKLGVFALSAAIAGFAGALLGAHRNQAATQDYLMLNGLPYLLLLVVGGASIVSGALMGGIFLQSFTWITNIWNTRAVSLFSRIGPGLAGIGIGHNPDGAIPAISAAIRGEDRRSRRTEERPPDEQVTPPSEPTREPAPTAGT